MTCCDLSGISVWIYIFKSSIKESCNQSTAKTARLETYPSKKYTAILESSIRFIETYCSARFTTNCKYKIYQTVVFCPSIVTPKSSCQQPSKATDIFEVILGCYIIESCDQRSSMKLPLIPKSYRSQLIVWHTLSHHPQTLASN